MAGILANSTSVTMTSGDESADNSESGFVTGEQITLTALPTGSSYSWAMAVPGGSVATMRGDDTATALFTPDVGGTYTIGVTVDSTTSYTLRIVVAALAQTQWAQAMSLSPVEAATVPAPALGEKIYYDKTAARLRAKDSDGVVRDIDPSQRRGTFTLSGGAATVADTSVTASTVVTKHCETSSNRGVLTITLSAGVGFSVASSDGSDASTWRYALIG